MPKLSRPVALVVSILLSSRSSSVIVYPIGEQKSAQSLQQLMRQNGLLGALHGNTGRD
jgi:hypothetical protein